MVFMQAPLTVAAGQFGAHMNVFGAAADSLFDGMFRLMDMQVHASKAAFMEAGLAARAALYGQPGMNACLDGARYSQLQMAKAFSYGHEMAGIVGDLQGRMATLVQQGAQENRRRMAALLDA